MCCQRLLSKSFLGVAIVSWSLLHSDSHQVMKRAMKRARSQSSERIRAPAMKRSRGQSPGIATTGPAILAPAMLMIIAMRAGIGVDFYMTKYLCKAQEALGSLIPALPLRKLISTTAMVIERATTDRPFSQRAIQQLDSL